MLKYDLDRKGAGRILGVSIRTVDRYVKGRRLSSRVVDGRVWLDEGEVRAEFERRAGGGRLDVSGLLVDKSVEIVSRKDPEMETIKKLTERRRQSIQKDFIHKQEVDFQKILEQKQKIIDEVTYKIGKLQGETESSINIKKYYQDRENLQQSINKLELKNSYLQFELRFRKILGQILLITLVTFVLLLPLTLILIKSLGLHL